MTDERRTRAEIVGMEAAAANADEQLLGRLFLVNMADGVLEERLEPRQIAALAETYSLVTDSNDHLQTPEEFRAHVLGMAYGFQLGHDYALRYGRLGAEGPL